MSEILSRGKQKNNGQWVEGYYAQAKWHLDEKETHIIFPIDLTLYPRSEFSEYKTVIPETVGRYTTCIDKNKKKIFEGDVVQYLTDDDFDCQSIVKFGAYRQDGSGGEYRGTKCIGFYVEVDNFTCPDWCDNEPERFPYHMRQQNILEVASKCEVIGNIYDNPELLEGE